MRQTFKSQLGFVLATAGFAVGLGNIWRFPYTTGMNGGAAFLLVYVVISIVIGIPLLTAEVSLGRRSQLTPLAGMEKLTGSRWHPWNAIAWLGMLVAILTISYYLMLIAWIVAYFFMISTGGLLESESTQAAFDAFVARPGTVLLTVMGIVVVLALGVTRGVQQGVERVAKLAMPLLFVLLIILAIRSVTFEGAGVGLAWYLKPDFSALDAPTILAALGQSFYSIGIGMAVTFGFGSYLKSDESAVPGNAVTVVAFDTLVAFIAGLVIFPALFAFGMEPDAGPTLLFITMPTLFQTLPAGQLFGAVFFFLLLLAGITSAIAVLEVMSSSLSDVTRLSRKTATWATAIFVFVLSVPVVLSQAGWFGVDLFVLADSVTVNYIMPLSGLSIALYVAIGWGFDKFAEETNQGSGRVKVYRHWKPFVQFLIPGAVLIVVLMGFGIL